MGTTLMRFIEARFSIHVIGLNREYCSLSVVDYFYQFSFWDFHIYFIETFYRIYRVLRFVTHWQLNYVF